MPSAPSATPAPPATAAAGLPGRQKPPNPPSPYVGTYRCTSDGLLYRISHSDTGNTALQMQRRTDAEPDWRPAYPVNTDAKRDDIKRLLLFGSFIREEPTP